MFIEHQDINSIIWIIKQIYNTVKLGYNQFGYNKLQVKANKFFQFFISQMNHINQLGYNEFWL
jgi:hypothetical protein